MPTVDTQTAPIKAPARYPLLVLGAGLSLLATALVQAFTRPLWLGLFGQPVGNHIVDRDLALYYDALHGVASGPLWSLHRPQTLARFVAGTCDRYLAAYLERHKDDPAPEIARLNR